MKCLAMELMTSKLLPCRKYDQWSLDAAQTVNDDVFYHVYVIISLDLMGVIKNRLKEDARAPV